MTTDSTVSVPPLPRLTFYALTLVAGLSLGGTALCVCHRTPSREPAAVCLVTAAKPCADRRKTCITDPALPNAACGGGGPCGYCQ